VIKQLLAMKILTLIIKDVHFMNILNYSKKIETRDIRPKSFNKYYEYNASGDLLGLKPYDAIQFYVGYHTDRKSALVELESSELLIVNDEDTGEDLKYIHKGEEYLETIAEFMLGKVISKVNC
jgi:hypothetical protein